MKVVFITASAEPGKDGVGDYTRRLAANLILAGDSAVMLALSDKFATARMEETQPSDGIAVPVLRLPKSWGIKKQVEEANAWVAKFNPDWLSLQYVAFGFHPKGLPFGLGNKLKQLSSNAKWHIMFHELWVGMAKEESQKLKWWGRLQKLLIKSLVKNLKPAVLHTQTKLYQAHLQALGFNANYLPLFGNIPVIGEAGQALDEIRFIVFGAIHAGGLIEPFAKEAAKYSRQYGKSISLTFVGRCGEEQHQWARIWQAEGLPVEILGEQAAEQVSALLLNATAGINTTGLAVVEKSGAFAAMRDHGLPVISLSKPWTPFGVPPLEMPQGILKYDGSNFKNCLELSSKHAVNPYVLSGVTGLFIKDLLALQE